MTSKKTVLIADDDPDILNAMMLRCESLGLEVQIALDGLEAWTTVLYDPPDLLILDIDMPAADGLTVLQKLMSNDSVDFIPAVFLSGKSDDEALARCEALGAYYVAKGENAWDRLEPIIRELLDIAPSRPDAHTIPEAEQRADGPNGPKIVVVDDDPDIVAALKIRLVAMGFTFFGASNALQAYWMALKEKPDLIITDYNMPRGSGRYLLGLMKGSKTTANTPVIVLTGATLDDGTKNYGLERDLKGGMGAVAYLQKPLKHDELVNALSDHIEIPNPDPSAVVELYFDDEETSEDTSIETSIPVEEPWREKVRAVRLAQSEAE